MALEAQVRAKIAGQQDPQQENEALNWVYSVLGEQKPSGDFGSIMKDGTVLCRFLNKIQPGTVKKINKPMGGFQCMENINAFNEGVKKLGVPVECTFQSVDLYERKNIKSSINCLQALGSQLQVTRPDIPAFGPKPSQENKRNFSEEQLRAGDSIIGLQAGSNKGASQSGQNFGCSRHM